MTTRNRLLSWSLANAFGMALGFLTFIQTLMFLGFGLDFHRHWSDAAVEALAAVIVGAGELVGYPAWALAVTLIGFFVGGTAAALSGRALFDRIDSPPPPGKVEPVLLEVAT